MVELNYMNMFAKMEHQELIDYINMLNAEQKSLAYTIYGLTWNMFIKMLKEN